MFQKLKKNSKKFRNISSTFQMQKHVSVASFVQELDKLKYIFAIIKMNR